MGKHLNLLVKEFRSATTRVIGGLSLAISAIRASLWKCIQEMAQIV